MRWRAIALAAVVCSASAREPIHLNSKEYFEAPGFSFLLFHNNYQVGHQGGLQMILHEERLLDSGDLYAPGAERRVLKRTADPAHNTATVFGEVPTWKLGYQIVTRTDGERVFVTLKLDRPLEPGRADRAGFRICLFSGAYFGHSFQGDRASGVFPRQYFQRVLASANKELRVAQEDLLRSFTVRREDGGTFDLLDPRTGHPAEWFEIAAPFADNATEVRLSFAPVIDEQWRRPPVIGISQAGYHPAQPKRIVLELDPRDASDAPVVISKLEREGQARAVLSAVPKPWGNFLRYRYATVDFSSVREPGLYMASYRGQTAGPFRIASDVYRGVWEPTLEYFLPIQMCHVEVKEGTRVWHGPCHLDDALQAPANRPYIDGYEQGAIETKYAGNQHIPGLDWGGWHDAGDADLPAGSIADTTLALSLAEEEFKPALDAISVNRAKRLVQIHVPDGRPDIVEQIEYGVEGLLASFRVAGYIFSGIIESTPAQYSTLGDPAQITDNKVYDGAANTVRDDRWAFTNRNTGLQYNTVQALAAAHRALKESSPALAREALAAASKIWDYEQAHPPVYPRSAYAPPDSGFRAQEIAAAAEMLLTTAEARYRERLIALLPELKKTPAAQSRRIGGTLVRVLPVVKDERYTALVKGLAKQWKAEADERAASNPFGVEYPREVYAPEYKLEARTGIHSGFVWGHGWDLQEAAMWDYYFHKHLPEVFGKDGVFNVVNFVLGSHPASNESFVSGVGARSATVAYGFNRADWSHIPGGVISGDSLIKPDFMELKEFPFLWYQTEYVIGGAATYIFDVLAAEELAGSL